MICLKYIIFNRMSLRTINSKAIKRMVEISKNTKSTNFSSFSILYLLHFVEIRSVASVTRDLRNIAMLGSFQHCPPLQQGMSCSRGERNSYRAFRILSTKQGDKTVRKMSVEQAFVTLNKWIPIRKSSPQPPSFVVIDNPNYPYSGIL